MLDYIILGKRLFRFRIFYNILDVRNTQRKYKQLSYTVITKELYSLLQTQNSMHD
jgi:hypothetical protein